jgi:hypothetical protein
MLRDHTQATAKQSRCLLPFIVAVNAAALASIVLLGVERVVDRPLTLLALLALAAIVSTRPINLPIPGLKIVASDVFMLFALLALAPAAAPLVALASVLGVTATRGVRFLSIKTAFNAGALPLSMAAGAGAFIAMGGSHASPLPAVVPLLAATLAYALTNVVLTATVIHLKSGTSLLEICRQSVVLAVVSSVTSALLGTGMLLVVSSVGLPGLLLTLIPLVPLQHYHRAYASLRRNERPNPLIVQELREMSRVQEDARVHTASPVMGTSSEDSPVRR